MIRGRHILHFAYTIIRELVTLHVILEHVKHTLHHKLRLKVDFRSVYIIQVLFVYILYVLFLYTRFVYTEILTFTIVIWIVLYVVIVEAILAHVVEVTVRQSVYVLLL